MLKYKAKFKSSHICICIVDDTNKYDSWTKELVKNRADYTITNCTGMGFDVYVDRNIDTILKHVVNNYKIAVVISPGTEFTNGDSFFKNIPNNFSLIGHILDAGEGYYMLHPQCYMINLEIFDKIGRPFVGESQYFSPIITNKPLRSVENIHDDYTPLWVKKGNVVQKYKHCYHGWNLVKTVLENNLTIEAFRVEQRENKHYLYQDVNTTEWIYRRYNYCLSEHVYHTNTGEDILSVANGPIKNLIVPAAGLNWYNTIQKHGYSKGCSIKFYDYSSASLDWIKTKTTNIKDINFEYHKIDIINQPYEFLKIVDSATSYIEFSNIFSYEPTAALIPLKHRLEIQNKIIEGISKINKTCYVHFDQKAEDGFVDDIQDLQKAAEIKINAWNDLKLPPWHYSL